VVAAGVVHARAPRLDVFEPSATLPARDGGGVRRRQDLGAMPWPERRPGQTGSVYVPRFNTLDDLDAIRAMVRTIGSAELVTTGEAGYPLATRLPVVWDGDRLVLHIARANPHWRSIPLEGDVAALAIVTDAEAYVSPAWYATKAEHGRVVPTWNYSAVHLTGRVHRVEDREWLRSAVTLLTEQHESVRADPWAVTDAPATYVDKQLRAIVGLEVIVERVEAKAKLSQNRSEADRAGVVAGLRAEGGRREAIVAEQMDQPAQGDMP
jgi:transcriptional regulator